MDLKDFKLDRLKPDTIIKPFCCGDTDLDGFLFDDAQNYLKELMAVTYLLHNDDVTLAYFNLLNDKIAYTDVDKNIDLFQKRIGRFLPIEKGGFRSYPAVKIGRLAVHQDYQGNKIGHQILDFIKNNFVDNNKTGCKFITVDAYKKSTRFYEQNGFQFLSSRDARSDTRLMYFNLESISD
ncbi:GNAT family N-acetyltransferase [Salinimicrobium sp. WS361]|uniref:GNAT family N-acetyltransferase n=1 Tax=Salinimicrobium sp. WS361 TaxID=3425123 RepID=UPI003D6F9D20